MALKMRRLTWAGRNYGKMAFLDFPLGEGRAVVSAGDDKFFLDGSLSFSVQRSEKFGLEAYFTVFKRKGMESFKLRNPSKYNRVEIFFSPKDIEELTLKLEQIAAVLKKFYRNL